MIVRSDEAGKGRPDRTAVDLRQHRVESRAAPVAGDEDGNVVLMEARMSGLAAPFARLARQIRPTAFEGFEHESLVGFNDSPQRPGLVGRRGPAKPMPPAERRRRMYPAQLRGLGETLALDHRPRVRVPFVLLAQMRHRRFGQRIERAAATLAAEPQQPARAAPADNLPPRAVRTTLTLDPLDA